MTFSKALGSDDISGFSFVKDILDGDPTFAINFDRLQKHPSEGYIIFEFLLCEERQKVNPHSSHPRRYWHLNSRKFLSLYNVAKDLSAKLYLVNYAKKKTIHEDKIKVIKVISMNEQGIQKEEIWNTSRESFASWFKNLNKECSIE